MNAAEKILKDMDSKETKERMDQFVQKYIAEAQEQRKKAIEIVSNAEYITWLGNFTKEHANFSDDTWLYCQEKLSAKDNKRVEELHLLYNGIEIYANHNYIYPIECDFGGYYKIKFDGIGYELGRLIGQGTLFYCTRVEIENDKEFIDFNDIMINKERDNVTIINAKLVELSKFVNSVYECGVPYEAICETLEATLNKMKSKKE